MRSRDPKDMVREALDPGEELLWYGAPHVEAAAKGGRRSGASGFFVVLAGILALIVFQTREAGMSIVESVRTTIETNPSVLFGVGAVLTILALLRVFGFDSRSRLRRHFAEHAYGMTDRRIIVIEGSSVTSFAGDELEEPRLVERADGYQDLIFGKRPLATGSGGRTRDPVYLERATVGFKAISDAEEIKRRVEAWIADELRESADSVADFVEAHDEADTVGFGSKAGTATLRHSETGLTIDYPDEWSVRVRKKKKPFGKTFFDREKWGSPSEIFDWNYLRLEGPGGCGVDAEVFETPLLAEYESMATGRLAAMAGELIDSDAEHEQNGMRGFTVARRSPVQANAATGTTGQASVVTPFRHTVLHDGRYQIVITSKWPERSPELARAVDLVVGSVRRG